MQTKAMLGALALVLGVLPARAGEPSNRHVEDGVVVTFSLTDASGQKPSQPLREGDEGQVRFHLADATTGAPLKGANPSAWIDPGDRGGDATCLEKIPLYLRGLVGVRPMLDLNSYYLLVLNQDPSISVIDPVVGMTGRTSLAATVLLESPGADWVASKDGRRLFVSMPRAGKVAVVDAGTFKLVASVAAGDRPTRVALQPDGRLLWVGNDGGVMVIDADSLKPLGQVATGKGHHELAFSTDDRHAFVSNRDDGRVTVIDVASRRVVKQLATGPTPLALATSRLSGRVFVVDGRKGEVALIDPKSLAVVKRLSLAPGLGPMRFSDDGRFALVVNPDQGEVTVIDAGTERVAHRVSVGGKPYQVTTTRTHAYVRLLDSPKVALLSLSSLAKDEPPAVKHFSAGEEAPSRVTDLSIADSITRASAEAAVFVTSPGDNNTYFYMEGMNAPMGSFANYGHNARAVTVVDRRLREVQPGVYAASLRMPASGKLDVAFLLRSPPVSHCFAAQVATNPTLEAERDRFLLEFLPSPERVVAGQPAVVRFRLTNRKQPPGDQVRVVTYLAPGRRRSEGVARAVGNGVYELSTTFAVAGAWYVHVLPGVEEEGRKLPYKSLRVWER